MAEKVKSNVFYICPNGCQETWFFQEGIATTMRTLTEDDERMEDEHFNFTPAGPVRCYKCRTEAIVRTKTVHTIVTVE